MKQDKCQQQEDFLKLMQRYVDMKGSTEQSKLLLNTSMASSSPGTLSSSSGSSSKRSSSLFNK